MPGRMTSNLHVLLIYVICTLICSAQIEIKMRAWKRWSLLVCNAVFDVAAFLCWSLVCVCVISDLKNTRDWVEEEWKLQDFYYAIQHSNPGN